MWWGGVLHMFVHAGVSSTADVGRSANAFTQTHTNMQGARYARAWLRRQRPALAKDRHVAVPILLEV